MNPDRLRLVLCAMGLALTVPGCSYVSPNTGQSLFAIPDPFSTISGSWASLAPSGGGRGVVSSGSGLFSSSGGNAGGVSSGSGLFASSGGSVGGVPSGWGPFPASGSGVGGASGGWGSLTATAFGQGNGMANDPLAMARLHEQNGRTEQAERLYRELIRRSPGNPLPFHRLGVITAQSGKAKEAEQFFARAMAMKPNDPELLKDVGSFCYQAGRPQEAQRYMRRAAEIAAVNSNNVGSMAPGIGGRGLDAQTSAGSLQANLLQHAALDHATVLAQRDQHRRAMEACDRALLQLSKQSLQTGSPQPSLSPDFSSDTLAGQNAASVPDDPEETPQPPTPTVSAGPRTATSASTLPPSTFSASALASVPQPASAPQGQSTVQPSCQVATGCFSSGSSQTTALQPRVPALTGNSSAIPATAFGAGTQAAHSVAARPITAASTHPSVPSTIQTSSTTALSTFSPSALTPVTPAASQSLTYSSNAAVAQPPLQAPVSYPSTGFSAAMPSRVGLPAQSALRSPGIVPSSFSPAYPSTAWR